MSNAPQDTRSLEVITKNDLLRLKDIALEKINQAFNRYPEKQKIYESRLLGICLCQGGANHFIGLKSGQFRGVHDFDLWAFYHMHPGFTFWNRRSSAADFGFSKFGRSPLDPKKYVGRRVDVFWRTIPIWPQQDNVYAIRNYFACPKSQSAHALRNKAVILIHPHGKVGKVIWNPELDC